MSADDKADRLVLLIGVLVDRCLAAMLRELRDQPAICEALLGTLDGDDAARRHAAAAHLLAEYCAPEANRIRVLLCELVGLEGSIIAAATRRPVVVLPEVRMEDFVAWLTAARLHHTPERTVDLVRTYVYDHCGIDRIMDDAPAPVEPVEQIGPSDPDPPAPMDAADPEFI